jgi:hypothetical protein
MSDFRFLIFDFGFGPPGGVRTELRGGGPWGLRSVNQKSKIKNQKSIPGVCR